MGGLVMNEMKLAACGIDCNECNLYKAEHDMKAAEALVEWFRSREWIGKDENAEAVMKNAPFCKGCWNKTDVHWCDKNCNLLTCCEEKLLNHCGECGDFPCEKYKKWTIDVDHHKSAMEYLLSLKQTNK